jgi:hypothetical protein
LKTRPSPPISPPFSTHKHLHPRDWAPSPSSKHGFGHLKCEREQSSRGMNGDMVREGVKGDDETSDRLEAYSPLCKSRDPRGGGLVDCDVLASDLYRV